MSHTMTALSSSPPNTDLSGSEYDELDWSSVARNHVLAVLAAQDNPPKPDDVKLERENVLGSTITSRYYVSGVGSVAAATIWRNNNTITIVLL
jgi:hypothetical protein